MNSQRYKKIVQALFGMTRMINSGLQQRELLGKLAEHTAEMMQADSCSIFLFEEATSVLLSHGSHGLSAQEEAGATFAKGEGVAGWVAQHGVAAMIDDVTKDARYLHIPSQNLEIKSLLCIPMSVRAQVLGVMTVTSKKPAAFTREDEELLSFIGTSIVRDLENARLYKLAITDGLTRVFNRQYLLHRLPDEVERVKRYGDPLSIILFDVDHFKRLNDAHGHPAGDAVLRELADCVKNDLRETDALVRYGGEEFLALLPKTDLDGAMVIAERVRADVAAQTFRYLDVQLRITISSGVGQFAADESEGAFVNRVDLALYQAKTAGRNRVVRA
ncbi:MAG: sensor domain-containing diguanylate cyclase [Deltaproteobacteria bacterium]|nr:sensor domain-containing diguanylate cyclase [Deltaproteobacteria bacterium]